MPHGRRKFPQPERVAIEIGKGLGSGHAGKRTAKELEREADTLEEGSAQRRETGFKFPQE
jgi:hypothetical protein